MDIKEHTLQLLRNFQEKHPNSHVGGSVGLALRGIDLKRQIKNSDLDITIDEYEYIDEEKQEYEERTSGCDFDVAVVKWHNNMEYTKIDIRINPEPSFDIIYYKGHKYNVSKVRDILFWKQKYADKGVEKHQQDLRTITGEYKKKNIEKKEAVVLDLPF